MVDRVTRILARGMLVLGAVLFLAALAWIVLSSSRGVARSPAKSAGGAEKVAAASAGPSAAPTGMAPITPVILSPMPSPTLTPLEASPTATSTLFPLPDAGSRDKATATPELQPTAAPMVRPQGRARRVAPTPTRTPPPTPTRRPEDPPTRIVAPAIGLDAAIVPVGWQIVVEGGKEKAKWVVPRDLVGWHETSALPGEYGNTVLSGHSNVYARVFRRVPDLEPGDEITIEAGGRAYVYTVTEKHLVREAGVPKNVRAENARWIAPTGDVRLTLVTCWPVWPPGSTHRMIVVARP